MMASCRETNLEVADGQNPSGSFAHRRNGTVRDRVFRRIQSFTVERREPAGSEQRRVRAGVRAGIRGSGFRRTVVSRRADTNCRSSVSERDGLGLDNARRPTSIV